MKEVESSESMRVPEAVISLAKLLSGEAGFIEMGYEPGELTKTRTHQIAAGLLRLVSAAPRPVSPSVEGDWDERAPGLSALAADPVEALPRAAVLPPEAPASIQEAWNQREHTDAVERVRALMGGNPLDLAAGLLADVEDHRGRVRPNIVTAATDADRLALATHLEGTAAALLAGTEHSHPALPRPASMRIELAHATRTIQRLEEEVASGRKAWARAREREADSALAARAEKTRADDWSAIAEDRSKQLLVRAGQVEGLRAQLEEALGREAQSMAVRPEAVAS